MIRIKVRDLAEILKTKPIYGKGDRETMDDYYVDNLCFDSRKIRPKDLFLPFKGEKVDGHRFIPSVLEVASVTLTEYTDIDPLPGKVYIPVASVMDAMQEIALYVRNKYNKPVVGVTGSVGKTTTREMTSHVLESGVSVFHTEGNQNSQIGVPVTLSGMLDRVTDCAVIEMGISEEGGMDRLARMVQPCVAIVTNIGVAHMEFLGSQEGIRKEKLKIISRMDENGLLLLNADDPLLYAVKDTLPVRVRTYGFREDADIRATNIHQEEDGIRFTVTMDGVSTDVKLSAQGEHNVRNALAALGVAKELGISRELAEDSLSNFEGSRQKILHVNEITIIDDSYNASPDSMKAALNVLTAREGRKVAVLGDMFELGKEEKALHGTVGEYIREKAADGKAPDLLITVGPLGGIIGDSAGDAVPEKKHFENTEEAKHKVAALLKPGDTVLFKASNGMHFHELVQAVKTKTEKKRIAVFAGSLAGRKAAYIQDAAQLGKWIAEEGYELIYGAGKEGMMGYVSDAALMCGGNVTGIIPKFMKENGWCRENLTHTIVTEDLAERKQMMAEKADAFIALPGGLGTLEEIADVLSWMRIGFLEKPFVLFNTDGFYDGLYKMILLMAEEGFIDRKDVKRILITSDFDEIREYLDRG